jgi:DNA-directed RNA polymerase beta' subunit
MELRYFIWFAQPEDFDDFGNLNLKISTGRLRHRWVPTKIASAIRYLKHHPQGEGLRAAHDNHILVQIILSEEGAMEDLTSDYPNAIVGGLRGAVIRTPIDIVVPIMPRRLEEDKLPPPVTYISNRYSMINSVKVKEYSSLEMGLMTPEAIKEMSVIEVITPSAFKTAGEQFPVLGGVHDPRMGSIDETLCQTCKQPRFEFDASNSCPGHFGHVTLAVPIPKVAYLGYNKNYALGTYPILNCLNNVCHSCYEINIPAGKLDDLGRRVDSVFDNNKRNFSGFIDIRSLLKDAAESYHGTDPSERKSCDACGEFTPLFKFNHTSGQFFIPLPDERYLNGAKGRDYRGLHEVLRNIKDDQCKYFGLNYETSRPENLFFVNLPIAPNVVRPTGEIPGIPLKGLDDLTKLYQDVITVNEKLRDIIIRKLGFSREVMFTRQLYHAVSRVFDNQRAATGSGGTSMLRGFAGTEKAQSFKGIMNRFTGKEGRFRNNLQSKYVEEVSYSIIVPDPALAIDEVGVPTKVAMGSTVLEEVTTENFARIKQLMINGPGIYPGATRLIVDGDPHNEDPKNYKELNQQNGEALFESEVIVGSLIKRHILDGDYGLFNRAPSLHRQSVLALRARVRPDKALGMNPTVCIPFNADYDGDAMKLHFVQSAKAVDEAKRLMALDKNLIHARYGKLTVATDQDQTSGLYLLTHTDKRRKGEWDKQKRLGFTDEGIPYVSKSAAAECYTYVFSEIRDKTEIRKKWLAHKKQVSDSFTWAEWQTQKHHRTVDSLPESDVTSPDGDACYTGRALFSHLFTIMSAEYVSATFVGNTPKVDAAGKIIRKDTSKDLLLTPGVKSQKKEKERVIVYKGKLLQGTIEKDAFGEGGSSLAPSFIYHEGYEAGQAKLTEYIEMITRLGYAGHIVIGYTMGIADVSVDTKSPDLSVPYTEPGAVSWVKSEVQKEIDSLYDTYARKITGIQTSWNDGSFFDKAQGEDEKIFAATDPIGYIEETIINLTGEYEDRILRPIEDKQGAGNALQIAVRSKARGKDENVRQMGGSFGLVLVGGKRITSGINANRSLAHFPLISEGEPYDMDHPVHTGFVKSSYSKGMSPAEYWSTSTAGRRSTVESGQGQIADSGYLERKMIKALEPLVVNDKKQVINTRTGRVVSPLVGDDGLAPYHIRGSHVDINTDGRVITLQPLLFEFDCKHGKPLEQHHTEEYPEHKCLECSKGSDISAFMAELDLYQGIRPSKNSTEVLLRVLLVREVTKPNLKKMARRFYDFYQDSVCRTGEAIGATAGGCLGEPATQQALRSFHFAGKLSFQGSVKRTEQILESPLSKSIDISAPRTIVPMRPEHNSESMVRKVAAITRVVLGSQVISLISYDVSTMSLIIKFDVDKCKLFRLDHVTNVIVNQIKKAIEVPHTVMSRTINIYEPYIIQLNTEDQADLLRSKEAILSTAFSGIGGASVVTVADDNKDFPNRWVLDIRNASATTLNGIVSRLSEYVDVEALQTNNIAWIYRNFGMEAALWQIEQELDFQMNGPGGVGEYDYRYIRTICDLMGEEGTVSGLGPQGMGSYGNYSVMAGASLERVPEAIMGGSVMGNFDNLQGPAEAIVAGATVLVGDYVPKAE